MRNILILPDGTEVDFMYPKDRQIIVGTRLNVVMEDDSLRLYNVFNIVQKDHAILYYLNY